MDQFTCPTCRDMYELGNALIKWAAGEYCIQEISYTCFFCGVIAPMPHRDYCLHKKAKEFMENHNDRRDTEPTTTENIAVAG